MPEASNEAAILIATSFQALNRARDSDETTEICESIIIVVFACFFIEANLNYIIDKMNCREEMKKFNPKKDPGLADKIGWFYDRYCDNSSASSVSGLRDESFKNKLEQKFPGFASIREFRNDIAHGRIPQPKPNLQSAETLRQQAKDIVDELFKIAQQNNAKIPRLTTYEQAIMGTQPNPGKSLVPFKNRARTVGGQVGVSAGILFPRQRCPGKGRGG
jgi:hypothetical protein